MLLKNGLKKITANLTFKQREEFDKLIDVMQEFFEPVPVASLKKWWQIGMKIPTYRKQAELFSSTYTNDTDPSILIPAAANLMCDIRTNIKDDKRGTRQNICH